MLWLTSDKWVYLFISCPKLPLGQLFQIQLMGSAGPWNRPTYVASGGLLVHKMFFTSYILSDQVWWHNIKGFLSYCKNYIWKFMQAGSWHRLFKLHLSFWVWIVWKKREKNKIWISQEQKELFRSYLKNIFHSFWRAIIWWKN